MNVVDLCGKTFGRLSVIMKDDSNTTKRVKWICNCSCGNVISVRSGSLRSGNTKSCGCERKEQLISRNTTHGLSSSRIYQTWCNMKSRCDDINNDHFSDYGGRNITYDKSWESFEGFCSDMFVSYREGLSLERIDVNGNYNKENCCWIDIKEQAKNRRKPKNNTSGFTGVDYYENSKGTPYYRVRWVEDGKQKAKYFSCKKYSNAYDMACSFRQDKIQELGYGEHHGLYILVTLYTSQK